MSGATRQLNIVIISVKYFQNQTSNNKVMGPDTILLQDNAVTLTFKVVSKMLRATRRLNMVIISVKYFRNRLEITTAGHDFDARSRCDLDLQGRDTNVARDTFSQHGDHFCEIISKSDFK